MNELVLAGLLGGVGGGWIDFFEFVNGAFSTKSSNAT